MGKARTRRAERSGPRNLEDGVLEAQTEPSAEFVAEMQRPVTIQSVREATEAARAAIAQAYDAELIHGLNTAPPAWPVPIDDADLQQTVDLLKEHNCPLADVLLRLPHSNPLTARNNRGEVTVRVHHEWWLRCIGGLLNGQLVGEGPGIPGFSRPETDTHRYVEHSATWNGLTLRWYEWEPRELAERMRAILVDEAFPDRPSTADEQKLAEQYLRETNGFGAPPRPVNWANYAENFERDFWQEQRTAEPVPNSNDRAIYEAIPRTTDHE